MNQRISHLIGNPFEVQLSDVALLQDEIEKYPYFSTLRTLLLFAMKEHGHSSYQKELKKTSICCPSRVALYHYLQKEQQQPEIVKEIDETEISNLNPIPTPPPIAEIPDETESPVQTETEIHVESESYIETEEIEEKPVPETKPVEVSADSEMTFSEWLSLSSKKSTAQKEEPTEKDIKYKLIDEFIEKSPKISPLEKTVSQDTPAAKPGLSTEYSDLMTETLAQIYVNQRKFDKAHRAYRILSLKYPEKKEFFEDQIRKIEELGNL
ncbi:MAG: hypothetical protein WCY16_07875 [Weeksellaceae bacterium]